MRLCDAPLGPNAAHPRVRKHVGIVNSLRRQPSPGVTTVRRKPSRSGGEESIVDDDSRRPATTVRPSPRRISQRLDLLQFVPIDRRRCGRCFDEAETVTTDFGQRFTGRRYQFTFQFGLSHCTDLSETTMRAAPPGKRNTENGRDGAAEEKTSEDV